MFPSLMPKGVEHVEYSQEKLNRARNMFPSLMPKGVEHFDNVILVDGEEPMFPSLMPKGVEHTI